MNSESIDYKGFYIAIGKDGPSLQYGVSNDTETIMEGWTTKMSKEKVLDFCKKMIDMEISENEL
jgi:hypothetical protein